MIPDTTTVTVSGERLEWENHDFMISIDDAETVAGEIRDQIDSGDIEEVLVDNRKADGTWPDEVTTLWSELMGEMYASEIACATVSPSFTNAMQINQLAEENGSDDLIQAFTDYQEAVDFLETQ